MAVIVELAVGRAKPSSAAVDPRQVGPGCQEKPEIIAKSASVNSTSSRTDAGALKVKATEAGIPSICVDGTKIDGCRAWRPRNRRARPDGKARLGHCSR